MSDFKSILGIIAVLLTFAGYIPYFRDMMNGKTRPHIYSWSLWSFVTYLVFALQLTGQAGIGAFVTLSAAILASIVLIWGTFMKGKKDITRSDTIFLSLAFVSLFLWLVAKQPVLSAILATLTEVLGFIPTIRKSWKNPWSETLIFYVLNTIRFMLASLSLENYSIITALYPISWFSLNGLFAIMLHMRRRNIVQIDSPSL